MNWLREMWSLIRQYREVDRAYKASMKAIEQRVKERGRELAALERAVRNGNH